MLKAFNRLLPALALVAACLAGTGVVAGGHLDDRDDGVPAREKPRALALLGFRFENGLGLPQNYAAAADLYYRAAERGDVFAQSRLGLSYDKGHGVPQDMVLSYKWLNLAAARAARRQREYYYRLREAVAGKMSLAQISEGQRLALIWAANQTRRH